LSHAELDVAETLDDGDPAEFGDLHADLAGLLPGLKVVGGCCGTDHRHVECVSTRLHRRLAA
jgi:homocysteine S-methyltransferase